MKTERHLQPIPNSYDIENLDEFGVFLLQSFAAAPSLNSISKLKYSILRLLGFKKLDLHSISPHPEMHAMVSKSILISPLTKYLLSKHVLGKSKAHLVASSILDSRVINLIKDYTIYELATHKTIEISNPIDLINNFPKLKYFYSVKTDKYLFERRKTAHQ